MNPDQLLWRIRMLVSVFVVALTISGATAIPLEWEANLLAKWQGVPVSKPAPEASEVTRWLGHVRDALRDTQQHHPFLFYGTEWLAFGHFVIAVAFVGAWRDPLTNRWLFDWGLIACALLVPYALVFGALRGIPFWWRLIDCSFGVFGAVPLWLCRQWVNQLARCGDSKI
jgi:hypothetical protein